MVVKVTITLHHIIHLHEARVFKLSAFAHSVFSAAPLSLHILPPHLRAGTLIFQSLA